MVSSLDGAAAFDGRVRPLSNPADHHLLRALRAYCDVLLVGAGTVRAERYGARGTVRSGHSRCRTPQVPPRAGVLVVAARRRCHEQWQP
nr:dihydrofolate reductase family protein [Rhodococcus erythropolis]